MKKRVFTLFHLSLSKSIQIEMFEENLSKEEWIRKSLERQVKFRGRNGKDFYWTPHENIDNYIFGIIQAQKQQKLHNPPSIGGDETTDLVWQGSYVLIDPTNNEYGQRVSIENDTIGSPSLLINSLIDSINEKLERPYNIEVEAIFDEKYFWDFAERNGNLVKSIKFDFVTPNMFESHSNIFEDLKDINHQTGAQRVSTEITSKDGVRTDNNFVREGVNYASDGSGDIRAVSLKGEFFYSKKKAKTVKLNDSSSDEPDKKREWFKTFIGRILGNAKLEKPSENSTNASLDNSD